jgi:hypothetical protein
MFLLQPGCWPLPAVALLARGAVLFAATQFSRRILALGHLIGVA